MGSVEALEASRWYVISLWRCRHQKCSRYGLRSAFCTMPGSKYQAMRHIWRLSSPSRSWYTTFVVLQPSWGCQDLIYQIEADRHHSAEVLLRAEFAEGPIALLSSTIGYGYFAILPTLDWVADSVTGLVYYPYIMYISLRTVICVHLLSIRTSQLNQPNQIVLCLEILEFAHGPAYRWTSPFKGIASFSS